MMISTSNQRFPLYSFKKSYIYVVIDRYTEIERENRILLEKMTTIMSHKPKPNDSNLLISLNNDIILVLSRSIVMNTSLIHGSNNKQFRKASASAGRSRSRMNSAAKGNGSQSPGLSSRSNSAHNRSLNFE